MKIIRVLPAFVLYCLLTPLSDASLAPLGQNDFAPTAITLDFSGFAVNPPTEVNGLVVNNVLFGVTENGLPTNGIVFVDGGLSSNNVTPPHIVSISNSNLALEVSLPASMTQFGYGYAIFALGSIPEATTMQLFSGITPVGSMDFLGAPDPAFTGGFAGVSSTVPFDRAVLTFSALAPVFAVDNVTFANTAANVPEQGWTLLLFAIGVCAVFYSPFRRHRLPA
jgi:hypothetical protein